MASQKIMYLLHTVIHGDREEMVGKDQTRFLNNYWNTGFSFFFPFFLSFFPFFLNEQSRASCFSMFPICMLSKANPLLVSASFLTERHVGGIKSAYFLKFKNHFSSLRNIFYHTIVVQFFKNKMC